MAPLPHPPQRVRDGALEWFIAEYEGKEKIKVTNSGSGNFDEFKVFLCQRPPVACSRFTSSPRPPPPRMLIACCSFEADPVFQASLAEERISFGFLRMISGDQVTASPGCCFVGHAGHVDACSHCMLLAGVQARQVCVLCVCRSLRQRHGQGILAAAPPL